MFSTCCGKGKVSFVALSDSPALLQGLLTEGGSRARQFRRNLRAYNNVLSMASVVAKWVSRGPGPSTFNPTITMQGRMYHYIGALLPSQGRSPAFASVYIHDTDYATQSRTRLNAAPQLDEALLAELAEMLHGRNPYVQTFLSMREWATSDDGANAPAPYQMVIHADRRPSNEHVRRYNGPEASEVAVLIPGNEDGEIGRRDIVVRKRGILNSNGNEVLDPISVTHRSYDPLSYALLFPDGRDGWHPELRFFADGQRRHTKVTPLMFYSWQLFQRPSEFSTILHASRLFQQYLVDQYYKVECERMSYLRANQTNLRASDYTSLRDSLGDSGRGEDEADAVRAGRLFILPSTHIGGDRYMRQQMHDIIAISNQVGHPDIFLTMTCNPNWPEIRRSLLPNQIPQNRPDLCARVFRLKLKDLMSNVIDEQLFGTVAAHVRVIEFQKRGLPHAHVILFLDETFKNELRAPENVDRVISAEIPPASDPELQELVLKHMIHNPCGEFNPSAPCMGEQFCRKGFPKPFKGETGQSDSEYYITYRRRSPDAGGVSVERNVRGGRRQQSVIVNNSWVVPHSPALLRSFACHINVELCVSRIGGIKYLFKYVCKGQDRVTMEIMAENDRYDEISNFQDARYVSASEAAWRLLSFDIVDRLPPVLRLEVHLENHHTVCFEEGKERAAAAQHRPGTKLTEWFKANEKYPGAQGILYHEFPKYFTWNKSRKSWAPRAILRRRNEANEATAYEFSGNSANVVGRIYTVSPREGERYFLRLLLTHVPGATSFQHLRTVEDVQCSSFREACLRLGLLADDAEWRHTLRESFRSRFVPISHVFTTILAYCEPSDPRSLWDEHVQMFLTDIRARARGNPHRRQQLSDDEHAVSHVLSEVQKALQSVRSNCSLLDYGLPQPAESLPPLQSEEPVQSSESLLRQCEERVQTSLPLLNAGQRQAFDEIVGSIIPGVSVSALLGGPSAAGASTQAQDGRLFFLDAPSGTGKTFLLRTIQDFLRCRRKKVIPVATSAVAAVLLDAGRTAHSVLNIPIPVTAESTCNVSANSDDGRVLKEVDLIIWDKIVMCHRHCIEAVDRSLRDLTETDRPFGGTFLVLAGDFRQILPVVPGGSRAQIVNACVKSSCLYQEFRFLRLTENMRLSALRADPSADSEALQFPEFLLSVGEGRVQGSVQRDMISLPGFVSFQLTIRNLCLEVFEGVQKNYNVPSWLTTRVILTTKNSNLVLINEVVGNMIPGAYKTYLCRQG